MFTCLLDGPDQLGTPFFSTSPSPCATELSSIYLPTFSYHQPGPGIFYDPQQTLLSAPACNRHHLLCNSHYRRSRKVSSTGAPTISGPSASGGWVSRAYSPSLAPFLGFTCCKFLTFSLFCLCRFLASCSICSHIPTQAFSVNSANWKRKKKKKNSAHSVLLAVVACEVLINTCANHPSLITLVFGLSRKGALKMCTRTSASLQRHAFPSASA